MSENSSNRNSPNPEAFSNPESSRVQPAASDSSPVQREAEEAYANPYRFSVRHNSVSSWLTSVVIHAAVVAILLIALYQIPKGVGKEQVVTGSIVLVADSTDQNDKVYLDQSDVESPDQAEDAAAAAAAAQAAAAKTPLSMDDLPDLPGMNVAEDSAAQATTQQQAMTGVGEMTIPTAQTGGGKLGQKAVKFGGVQGTGSKFVYVVDRSASMNDSNARLMNAAKAELEQSLRSLNEQQQFQIVFYNDEWLAFQREAGPLKLYEGTEANLDAAIEFSRGISGAGGTQHVGPILEALRMGADVVFLLTDADNGLTLNEINDIERANRTGAVICVIVYGASQYPTIANESFRKLTQSTGGTFKFKAGR